MLDADLAALYEVSVKRLNEQVARNRDRFPEDFMFQLTPDEADSLRSQTATLKTGARGQHRKYLPFAFTEQGVAMLSSVLRSPRAVLVNIEIMRAFVRLRRMLASHAELARKLANLEKKYDAQFKVVFDAIRQLMTPLESKKKRPTSVRRPSVCATGLPSLPRALGLGATLRCQAPPAPPSAVLRSSHTPARPQWLYGAMGWLLRPPARAYLVLRAFASLSVARSV